MDLHETCKALFAGHRDVVQPSQSCARDWMLLAVPAGGSAAEFYELTRSGTRWRTSYGLFPQDMHAGYGSFILADGRFIQHGQIGQADFERILATATPVNAGQTEEKEGTSR